MPRSRYDFNALGEVYLLDFDEDEEFKIVRPVGPLGLAWAIIRRPCARAAEIPTPRMS